jgi:hypothetical protein
MNESQGKLLNELVRADAPTPRPRANHSRTSFRYLGLGR